MTQCPVCSCEVQDNYCLGQHLRRRHPDWEPPHGTVKRYRRGCRCVLCRRANTDLSFEYARARGVLPIKERAAIRRKKGHGFQMAYKRGCRCDECMDWMRQHRRRFRVNGSGMACPECGVCLDGPRGVQVHVARMHKTSHESQSGGA